MNPLYKKIITYTLSFAVAIGLFSYLYGEQNIDEMLQRFSQVNWIWLLISALLYGLSNWSRGWRWAITLKPLGYEVSQLRAFLGVMVGYLANLVLPRMGEITRCGILLRISNVPVSVSFGSVITERIFDLFILLGLVVFTVFLEFDKIGIFVVEQFGSKFQNLTLLAGILAGVAILGMLALFMLYKNRHIFAQNAFYQKISSFLIGLKNGIFSIKDLSAQEAILYVVHTIFIWLMYLMATYAIFKAVPETANLPFVCVLVVLVMGSLGVAMPVQGGVGFFHLFVAIGLSAYGVSKEIGNYFALLSHSFQIFNMLTMGLISLLISFLLSPKVENKETSQ